MMIFRRLILAAGLLVLCSLNRTPSLESKANLPIWFESNRGQADSRFQFISRTPGYTALIAPAEISMVLQNPTLERSAALKLQFVGAHSGAKLAGRERLPAKVNYITGNRPDAWITDIPAFGAVECQGLYDGIDVVFYGNQRQLEYDMVLSPGASPASIALHIEGVEDFTISEDGDLTMKTEVGFVSMKQPVIYQEMGGHRRRINGKYVILDDETIGFRVEEYDRSKPLTIDPVLSYSTFLGGTAADSATQLVVDSNGNVYVTGETFSTSFRSDTRRFGPQGTSSDAFVAKLSASGQLIYSTIIGGSDRDSAKSIKNDEFENVFVAGSTFSKDFPLINPIQSTPGGQEDAFVLQLDKQGVLQFSTYFGGSGDDSAVAVAVETSGIYFAGTTNSIDFPRTPLPPPVTIMGYDVFAARLTVSTPSIVYARPFGGSGNDIANGMVVDSTGNVYITGRTDSTDFPRIFPLQPQYGGAGDAFLMKINSAGSLTSSTYLGGSDSDVGTAIAIDSTGIYIAGQTKSQNFPVQRPVQTRLAGNEDGFVTKLSVAGSSLIFSTYLGGTAIDSLAGIAIDGSGNVLLAGSTDSNDYPILNPLQDRNLGSTDIILSRFTSTGTMIFSSYLGGQLVDSASSVAVDAATNVYLTGTTRSSDFPIANPAQAFRMGESDAFVTKIPDAGLRPVNDDFVNAILIGGISGATTGNNFGATQELKEPPPPRLGRTSVWWQWVAPFTGPVTFDTIGSTFDTMLGIYRGTELSTLVGVASDDDSGGGGTSRVTFAATEGVTYYLAVTGFSNSMGYVALNWSLTIPPFTSPVLIRGLPIGPRPGTPAGVGPAQQQLTGLSLATPYPVLVTGQLQLVFTPDPGLVDDPAIQFNLGGRTANFRIAPNTADAVFDDGSINIQFQTGTVAGTITVRATLSVLQQDVTPVNPPQGAVAVGPQAPAVTDVQITSSNDSSFEVVIVGFSTPRNMRQAVFDFRPSEGSKLQTTSVSIDLEPTFISWYDSERSRAFGSQFRLTVPFVVNGGTLTAFRSMTVTLTNRAGSAQPVTRDR
jgi:hypothetical protein